MFGFRALAVSADGKMALKKIDNLNVELINIENKSIIHHFKLSLYPDLFESPSDHYLVAKFSSCGRFVLFGTAYFLNRPRQYNTCISIKTGTEVDVIFNLDCSGTQSYQEIAYSHDGQYLVSSNSNGVLNLTNTQTGKLSCQLIAEEDLRASYDLDHCYFSPCNRFLAVYLNQLPKNLDNKSKFFANNSANKLLIVDVRSGQQIFSRNNSSLFPRTVEFSRQEDVMLVCLGIDSLARWELIKPSTGEILSHGDDFKPLAFTENLIFSNINSCITIMDLSLNIIQSIPCDDYKPTSMLVSPNSRYLAVELENIRDFTDKIIYLYRISDMRLILNRYAQQFAFAEDSLSISLLVRDLNKATHITQFQTSDGTVIADKSIDPSQLSFFIRSVLPGNQVILDDNHQTWCEQLNIRLKEALRISHSI